MALARLIVQIIHEDTALLVALSIGDVHPCGTQAHVCLIMSSIDDAASAIQS